MSGRSGLERHTLGARLVFPHKGTPPSLSPRGLAWPDGPFSGNVRRREVEAQRNPEEGALERAGALGSLPCAQGAGQGGTGTASPPRHLSAPKDRPRLLGGQGEGAGAPGSGGAPSCARRERLCAPAPLFLVRVPPSAAPALAPYLERRHP